MIIHQTSTRRHLLFGLLLFTGLTYGQGAFGLDKDPQKKSALGSSELTISPFVQGTLLIPEAKDKPNLVLIIPGSGPTDRNGNQPMMNNNALKFLAQGLFERGIATFRYDKRVIPLIGEVIFKNKMYVLMILSTTQNKFWSTLRVASLSTKYLSLGTVKDHLSV